jgi:serine/threonine protein kinase
MLCRKANIEFDLIRPIGNNEGKNSKVFLARDKQLDAELVVKQMEISKFNNIDEYFLEAKILYDCKHPNIMEIQYASQDSNYIYLSMPYHKKGSLNSLIDKKHLTVREIIKYSLDLLSGVAYIHSKGLLHLDIKPTNVLLDQSDRAILTDFGLSRYIDENGVANQPINYTYHFDPEFLLHSGRTVLSDIYQIGLTLYRICNGNNILREQFASLKIDSKNKLKEVILKGEYPKRDYYLPHIPNKLRRIIKKALDIDTSKRYNNVIQMMNDLSDIDENLDWNFTGDSNELYYLLKGNNKISISTKNENGKVEIICTKTNLLSGRITRMYKYCSKGHTTNKSVYKEIERIIKENN